MEIDMRLRLLVILLTAFVPFMSQAADVDSVATVRRPVVTTVSVEAGGGQIVDSYLSPLKFNGVSLAMAGRWMKSLPGVPSWRSDLSGRLSYITGTPTYNMARIYSFGGEFDWALMHGWVVADGLTLSAGVGTSLFFGADYLPVNGNNPATGKLSADLTLCVSASKRFMLFGKRLTVSDYVSVPSLGAFFSQGYGESYYEIWLGNRSGLAHFGWWGNHFCLSNELRISYAFRSCSLSLGYRFGLRSSWVDNVNCRVMTNAVTLGLTINDCDRSSASSSDIYPLF